MVNIPTIIFSLLEALMGYGWLQLDNTGHGGWAAIVLFAGLTIEHIIQGQVINEK